MLVRSHPFADFVLISRCSVHQDLADKKSWMESLEKTLSALASTSRGLRSASIPAVCSAVCCAPLRCLVRAAAGCPRNCSACCFELAVLNSVSLWLPAQPPWLPCGRSTTPRWAASCATRSSRCSSAATTAATGQSLACALSLDCFSSIFGPSICLHPSIATFQFDPCLVYVVSVCALVVCSGILVCGSCSEHRWLLKHIDPKKPQRVCAPCHKTLNPRKSCHVVRFVSPPASSSP